MRLLPIYICACGKLVFHDLRDGAHGALLHAIAAGDARIFIHSLNGAVHDFQNLLRARVNADAATDALVSFDDWM